MNHPFVSVIIPVFNGENYVAEAIESALSQDYPYREVIVVDDGSHDATFEAVSQFGHQVQYIRQENQGVGAARNTGICAASGSHFAFLDHDDLWARGKLLKQIDVWVHEENDPLIFGFVEQFHCDQLSEAEKTSVPISKPYLPGMYAGTLLMSRERFMQLGHFKEDKQVGEFIDWYFRVIDKNVPVKMLPEILTRRRIHRSNMGRQADLYSRADYLKVLKAGLTRRRQQHAELIS
ncbi:MAG: glycosyltransferase family 2 protein [Gammaproteobacteria bacterium]|nr:glycosyltransferase family 2 protein [Gammaproteobacteria bacterium]